MNEIEFERRLVHIETELQHMAKSLEVQQHVARLDQRLQGMEQTFATSSAENSRNFGAITKQLERLSSLNEEQMQKAGEQAARMHQRELALKDAEILKAREEAEAARIINKIKTWGWPFLQFVIGVVTVLGIVWLVFVFGVQQAAVPPVQHETAHPRR